MYEVFAYWNAAQIQAVLNAVVGVIGSTGTNGDYLALIRIVAILGFFVVITGAIVKFKGEDAVKHMLFVGIFYTAMLVPRVTVTIIDTGIGAGAARTVANVYRKKVLVCAHARRNDRTLGTVRARCGRSG